MNLEQTEKIVVWLTAGASICISLFHALGGFDPDSGMSKHIPILTLLVVAGLLPMLIHIIEKRIATLLQVVKEMQRAGEHSAADQVNFLQNQIDPRLRAVFGEHISELLATLDAALREQRIYLHDIESFPYFYRRTLEKFPEATLFATSLPLRRYFWRNQQTEQAMADFIKRKGRIVRIFFLESIDQLKDAEVVEILNAQIKVGVEVYLTIAGSLPSHLRRLFIVESQDRIAWEASVGPSQEITQIAATSDPKVTKRFRRDFDEILEMSTTQRLFHTVDPV